MPAWHILSLSGLAPNPARADGPNVAFTLPATGPGSLTLFDVAGRRVAWQDLSTFSPGPHTVRLTSARLGAGLYLIHLSHGGHHLTARGVVMR